MPCLCAPAACLPLTALAPQVTHAKQQPGAPCPNTQPCQAAVLHDLFPPAMPTAMPLLLHCPGCTTVGPARWQYCGKACEGSGKAHPLPCTVNNLGPSLHPLACAHLIWRSESGALLHLDLVTLLLPLTQPVGAPSSCTASEFRPTRAMPDAFATACMSTNLRIELPLHPRTTKAFWAMRSTSTRCPVLQPSSAST